MGCGPSTPAPAAEKPAEPTPAAEPATPAAEPATPAAEPAAPAAEPAADMAEPSAEFTKFSDAIKPLGDRAGGKDARKELWKTQIDANGNNIASLKDIDGWVLTHLQAKYPEDGEALFKNFRPSYIRAFKDAADTGKAIRVGDNGSTTDDYIMFNELRVCMSFLNIYALFYDAFKVVDGSATGCADLEDRKLSAEECTKSLPKLQNFGLVGLKDVTDAASAEACYKAMDADGKGAVMLSEFSAYLKAKEIEADTDTGKLLAIGDDVTEETYEAAAAEPAPAEPAPAEPAPAEAGEAAAEGE